MRWWWCSSQPLAADQFLHHLTMKQHTSHQATTLLELSSALRPHCHTPLVNQWLNKPGHQSCSLCNWCVHLFDHLQIPDHVTTPTTCTEHQDYPDLLDTLSPWIFRQHWLLTPLKLHRHYATAVILHLCKPFVYDLLNKGMVFQIYLLVFVILCLVHCQSHNSSKVCGIDIFIDPTT